MSTTEPGGRVFVVRHGETSANLEGVWHGSTDTPLTELGHTQAARAARWFADAGIEADALYCSDLQRARHTAQPIGEVLGLTPKPDPGVREYDLGRWEGRSYRELQDAEKLWDHMRSNPHFAPHGGETPKGVADRWRAALQRIATAHETGIAIVVSHGGAISLGLGLLLENDYGKWTRVMENCAISELWLTPTPRMTRFNSTEHLDALHETPH